MLKTFLILDLFIVSFFFANLLIFATILSCSLKWLFGGEFSHLFLFGFLLSAVILCLHGLSINFCALYAARGEANKCLDLLRIETLKDPIKKNYSCTHGSCTAVLRLGPNINNANNAAAEVWIDSLAREVTRPFFMGTARHSGESDGEENLYASLHCRNSWGGIAQWIAKRHLGNSAQEELAPCETTHLLP